MNKKPRPLDIVTGSIYPPDGITRTKDVTLESLRLMSENVLQSLIATENIEQSSRDISAAIAYILAPAAAELVSGKKQLDAELIGSIDADFVAVLDLIDKMFEADISIEQYDGYATEVTMLAACWRMAALGSPNTYAFLSDNGTSRSGQSEDLKTDVDIFARLNGVRYNLQCKSQGKALTAAYTKSIMLTCPEDFSLPGARIKGHRRLRDMLLSDTFTEKHSAAYLQKLKERGEGVVHYRPPRIPIRR